MKLFKALAQTLPLIPIVSYGSIDCAGQSEVDFNLFRAIEVNDAQEGHNLIFAADRGSVSSVESGMETQAAPNKFETK